MLVELPPALAAAEALITLSRALGPLADRVRPALDTPHPRPPLCGGGGGSLPISPRSG